VATYGLDDPEVDGVSYHFTVPERGGFKGWIGVAEEVSDISLSCSQVGPITFKAKFEQGEDVFRKRRSLFFKKMQIVRGCDVKRNVLVYMVLQRQDHRRVAEEFHVLDADHAMGKRQRRKMRGLDREIARHAAALPRRADGPPHKCGRPAPYWAPTGV
jgi:hypothetical protein